ncbi:hypothetical protein NEMIN01_0565 [Nematocida minor]|uniref:uncharacterized protein n=1 Tax=Nematocida minor TaxID=1912983 RepID=UPI00221EB144|nr:uncharacterized protein NEMIN01_0565 [Nematocida minor]KAI5189612.1 hypothetical protein NEMIN01_0565 [Nematocida minor]
MSNKQSMNQKLFLWLAACILYIGVALCDQEAPKKGPFAEYIKIERAPNTINESIKLLLSKAFKLSNSIVEFLFSFKVIKEALKPGMFSKVMLAVKIGVCINFIFNFSTNRENALKPVVEDLKVLEAAKTKKAKKEEEEEEEIRRIAQQYKVKNANRKDLAYHKNEVSNNGQLMMFSKKPIDRSEESAGRNRENADENINILTKDTMASKVIRFVTLFSINMAYAISLFNSFIFLFVTLTVLANYLVGSSLYLFLYNNCYYAYSFFNIAVRVLESLSYRNGVVFTGCLVVFGRSLSEYYNAFCLDNRKKRAVKLHDVNLGLIKNTIVKALFILLAVKFNLSILLIFIDPTLTAVISDKVFSFLLDQFVGEKRVKKIRETLEDTIDYDKEVLICKIISAIGFSISAVFLVYLVGIAVNSPNVINFFLQESEIWHLGNSSASPLLEAQV